VSSSIRLADCAQGTVGNAGGELVCSAPHADNVPAGDYTASCSGCSVKEGKLSCVRCNKSDGSFSENVSEKVAHCSAFTNQDGKLKCAAGGEPSETVPPVDTASLAANGVHEPGEGHPNEAKEL